MLRKSYHSVAAPEIEALLLAAGAISEGDSIMYPILCVSMRHAGTGSGVQPSGHRHDSVSHIP